LLALAEAHIRGGEAPTGRALCLEVASLARGLGAPELLAEATLIYGRVFTVALVDPVLVGLIEESLAALPAEDSSVRVRLLARLAAGLQPAVDVSEPVRVARQAIESARRLGEPSTLLGAIIAGMSAMMDIIDARERLPLNLEAEHLAARLGESEHLLRTHARLVIDHLELGDLAAADARIEAFAALAAELRAPWWAWRAPLFRAMRAVMHGRFAEAVRWGDEALAAGRAAREPDVERICMMSREGLLRAWEQHADLAAFEPTARRLRAPLYRGDVWQASASAMTAARREDIEGVRRYLAMVPTEMVPPINNPYAMVFFVEALALVGPDDVAARLHAMLLPWDGRAVVLGLSGFSWEGPAARLLALLEARLGRWDEAVSHFEGALAQLERLDAMPWLARTRYELGRALLQRGRPEDRERARSSLQAARTLAEALGQEGLRAQAERRLAGLAPAAAVVEVRAPAFTIATEGESWVLGFEGQTFRLKDSLGLRYLAHLVGEPDREVHVLELARGRDGIEEGDAGDSGELLDGEARDSYRRRLEDLREELSEAESFGDGTRAARIREEIEFLGAELGRAVGLGGRSRRAGVAAERARSAVQRRIKNALDRIAEQSPALAAHLGRTLRTGNFCVYRPAAH
jgi:tetratricopeptide (TPR) repeat protein